MPRSEDRRAGGVVRGAVRRGGVTGGSEPRGACPAGRWLAFPVWQPGDGSLAGHWATVSLCAGLTLLGRGLLRQLPLSVPSPGCETCSKWVRLLNPFGSLASLLKRATSPGVGSSPSPGCQIAGRPFVSLFVDGRD